MVIVIFIFLLYLSLALVCDDGCITYFSGEDRVSKLFQVTILGGNFQARFKQAEGDTNLLTI